MAIENLSDFQNRFIINLMIIVLMTSVLSIISCKNLGKLNSDAEIKFEYSEFDFGILGLDEKVNCVFVYYNSSDSPLLIQKVKSSCGCTITDWSERLD